MKNHKPYVVVIAVESVFLSFTWKILYVL